MTILGGFTASFLLWLVLVCCICRFLQFAKDRE